MAHSRGIIESAQEFLHSSKLSGVSNRGGSSLLRFALPKGQKATFDLRSRRSGIRGGGGRSARTPVAGENGGSRSSIREGPQGETPVASGLYAKIYGLIDARFGRIRKPIRKNLAVLTVAFLQLLGAARSGYGSLSLAGLARLLPTVGSPHAREKRLHRFLKNRYLDYRTVAASLGGLLLAERKGFCPVLFDQTKVGKTQGLVAAIPYAGRALPIACYTFDYPLTEPSLKSQNQLEHLFLLDTEQSLPQGITPVWIGDRGYARAALFEQSEKEERPYIIRGRKGVVINYGGQRMKLGGLKGKPYQAVRYENVLYQSKRQVAVDVTVYGEPHFKETWYLITPVSYRSLLATDEVVKLYRERMQIEHSFRDFKTHLGLRGLKLHVDTAARMGRLLLAFCVTYVLCVLLGESALGYEARAIFEIPRRSARHGTTRTLSALTLSMLMLSHPDWRERSMRFLLYLARRAMGGHAWLRPIIAPG